MIREDGTSTIIDLVDENQRKYGVHDEQSGYRATIWHGDKVRIEGKHAHIADLTPEQVYILSDLLVRMRDVLALPATG